MVRHLSPKLNNYNPDCLTFETFMVCWFPYNFYWKRKKDYVLLNSTIPTSRLKERQCYKLVHRFPWLFPNLRFSLEASKPAFNSSKLIMETLEQGVEYVQSWFFFLPSSFCNARRKIAILWNYCQFKHLLEAFLFVFVFYRWRLCNYQRFV